MKKLYSLLVCTFLMVFQSFTQSPGGVGANLTAWFKANTGVTQSSASVSNWASTDAGVDLANATMAEQPTYNSGASDRLFNYNDYISFDGTDDYLIDLTSPDLISHLNGGAVFIISKPSETTPIIKINDYNSATEFAAAMINGNRVGVSIYNGTLSEWRSLTSYLVNAAQQYETTLRMTHISSTANWAINGEEETTPWVTDNGAASTTNNGLFLSVDSYSSPVNFTEMDVAEISVYDNNLTGTEIEKITSYYCLKYGITKGVLNTGAGEDYIDSNGTTFWDATSNSGYNYYVIGVGRDDNSGLAVYESETIHGVNDVSSVYSDIVKLDDANNTFDNDREFFMVGSNNGALNATEQDPPVNAAGTSIEGIFNRAWKIEHNLNATNGAINFILDISSVPNNSPTSNIRFLFDADGDFTAGSTASAVTDLGGGLIQVALDPTTVASGSYITIGTIDYAATALPVELVNFDLVEKNNSNYLVWTSSSEEDFYAYQVERSEDLNHWTTLEEVYPIGGNQLNTYQVEDKDQRAVLYYRLKMTDLDGSFSYSEILSYSKAIDTPIIIYPNPSTGIVNIKSDQIQTGTVRIINLQGKVILISPFNNGQQEYDFSNLSKGMYYLELEDGSNKVVEKLFIH